MYSAAEYYDLVWESSLHTTLVDAQLNEAKSAIRGTLKPTNIECLLTIEDIKSLDLRRKSARLEEYKKISVNVVFPIHSYKMETVKLKF